MSLPETPEGFPRLKDDGSRHERGCPCKSCIGRRVRRSGKAKQAAARRVIEKQTGARAVWRGHLANEESWDFLPIRAECKSGKQCQSMWARFLAAEAQSDQSHALGATKPFVFLAMPPDTSDGLVVFRLSKLAEVIEALGG